MRCSFAEEHWLTSMLFCRSSSFSKIQRHGVLAKWVFQFITNACVIPKKQWPSLAFRIFKTCMSFLFRGSAISPGIYLWKSCLYAVFELLVFQAPHNTPQNERTSQYLFREPTLNCVWGLWVLMILYWRMWWMPLVWPSCSTSILLWSDFRVGDVVAVWSLDL